MRKCLSWRLYGPAGIDALSSRWNKYHYVRDVENFASANSVGKSFMNEVLVNPSAEQLPGERNIRQERKNARKKELDYEINRFRNRLTNTRNILRKRALARRKKKQLE